MKKTIKIIDLLNKIANGEELPKKIEWCGVIFDYIEKEDYEDYVNDNNCSLFRHDDGIYKTTNILNDEVEILDEEEFETIDELLIEYDDGDIGINKKYISSQQSEIFAKSINQLIKNQKKIIQKLNKEN